MDDNEEQESNVQEGNLPMKYHPPPFYDMASPTVEDLPDNEVNPTLKDKADKGDVDAQLKVGQFYVDLTKKNNEENDSLNNVEGLKYFQMAADKENISAQFKTGLCYEYGIGTTQDYVTAAKYYTMVTENQTNDDFSKGFSYYSLGKIYGEGNIYLSDETNAAKCLEYMNNAATDFNNTEAYYYLGLLYEKGVYVDKNLETALENYEKANVEAKNIEKSLIENIIKARSRVTKAINEPKISAPPVETTIQTYNALQEIYKDKNGTGLEKLITEAENGDIEASYNVGIYYYDQTGNNGTRNYYLARIFFTNVTDTNDETLTTSDGKNILTESWKKLNNISFCHSYDYKYIDPEKIQQRAESIKFLQGKIKNTDKDELVIGKYQFYLGNVLIFDFVDEQEPKVENWISAANKGIDQAKYALIINYEEIQQTLAKKLKKEKEKYKKIISDIDTIINNYKTKLLEKIETDSTNKKAQLELGEIYYKDKDKKYITCWETAATETNKEDNNENRRYYIEANYRLGKYYFSSNSWDKAKPYLINAAKEKDYGRSVDAQFLLGTLYIKKGNKKLARFWYSIAAYNNIHYMVKLTDKYIRSLENFGSKIEPLRTNMPNGNLGVAELNDLQKNANRIILQEGYVHQDFYTDLDNRVYLERNTEFGIIQYYILNEVIGKNEIKELPQNIIDKYDIKLDERKPFIKRGGRKITRRQRRQHQHKTKKRKPKTKKYKSSQLKKRTRKRMH